MGFSFDALGLNVGLATALPFISYDHWGLSFFGCAHNGCPFGFPLKDT